MDASARQAHPFTGTNRVVSKEGIPLSNLRYVRVEKLAVVSVWILANSLTQLSEMCL